MGCDIAPADGAPYEANDPDYRGCGHLVCGVCNQEVERFDGRDQADADPDSGLPDMALASTRYYRCACVMEDGSICAVRVGGAWSPYHQGAGTELGARWGCGGHTG